MLLFFSIMLKLAILYFKKQNISSPNMLQQQKTNIVLNTNMEDSVLLGKSKTGEFKYSKPFRRTIFKYNHGIICRCCGDSSVVSSYSAKTPKYCGQVCRDIISRKRSSNFYISSKNLTHGH